MNLQSLTPLRGIAAIAILIHHATWFLAPSVGRWLGGYTHLVLNSFLFVDFFFLLSGFLLAHLYKEKLKIGRDVLSDYLSFLQSRFARIYPLHLVTLLVVLMVVLLSGKPLHAGFPTEGGLDQVSKTSTFIENLFLLQTVSRMSTTWNQPAWSIGAEVVMYVFFPLLLLVNYLSTSLKIVFSSTMIGALAWLGNHYGGFDLAGRPGVARCIAEASLGILAYGIYPYLRELNSGWATFLFVTGFTGALLIMHADVYLISIIPFFIVGILGSTCLGKFIGDVVNNKYLLRLGEISYSVYLWHWVILLVVFSLVPNIHLELPGNLLDVVVVLCFMFTTLLVSHFSYEWLEVPARAWLRGWR